MHLTILLLAAANILTTLLPNPYPLMLWPIPSDEFRPYQMVTYTFLHADALHLILNMVALLSFGPTLAKAWGWWRFLLAYLTAAALGGMMQATVTDRPIVGASAALFGLFAGCVIASPRKRGLRILVVPVQAWKVLVAYVLLTLVAIFAHYLPGVAHVAHLGGVLAGVAFALAYNDKPRL